MVPSKDVVQYDVSIPSNELLSKIKQRCSQKLNWFDSISGEVVNYREFEMDADVIRIKRARTMMTWQSQINLQLMPKDADSTTLKFELISFHKLFPWLRIVVIVSAILLSVFAVMIERSVYTMFVIAFGWILFSCVSYVYGRFQRSEMVKYTALVVKDLKVK